MRVSLKDEWDKRALTLGATKKAVLFKRFPSMLNNKIHKAHIDFIAKNIQIKEETKILDVGCGYGRISSEIRDMNPHFSFEGVELSSEFSNIYRSNIGPCFCGSIQDYAPNQLFDCVIAVTLLMYIEQEELNDVVNKLKSMLPPNGTLICIEPALEFQSIWRKITHKKNASATGGDVSYFSKTELKNILVNGSNITDYRPIQLMPFLPPVHHAFSIKEQR